MFSLTNKGRRFAWIKNVVAHGSGKVQPALELDMHSEHQLNVFAGTERSSICSEDSLFSLGNPVIICENGNQVDIGDATEEEQISSEESCNSSSEGIAGNNIPEDGDRRLEVTSSSKESHGLLVGIMMGGVMLGAPIIAEQIADGYSESGYVEEQQEEREENHARRDYLSVELNQENDNDVNHGSSAFQPSQYLEYYYDMMYYFGLSTYKRHLQIHGEVNWRSRILALLQKGSFLVLVVMSALQSIAEAKLSLLFFLSEDGKSRYYFFVQMAYNLTSFAAKVHVACMLALKKKKTDKMLESMEQYETSFLMNIDNEEDTYPKICRWKLKPVVLGFIAISTFAVAVSRATLGAGASDPEGLILQSSKELGQDMFLWHSDNLTVSMAQIGTQYGTHVTPTAIAMGLVAITRDTAAFLQMGMTFDLVVVLGMVMYSYIKVLMKEIEQVTPNVSKTDIEQWNKLQSQREMVWKKYCKLKDVNDSVNEVFDSLLKLFHLSNLMRYAFFMILLIFWDANWILLTLYAVDLVKAEMGYFVAGKIAEQNDAIRTWIRNWARPTGKITLGADETDAYLVMDELDKEPIGLGKGKLLIHQSFHYKFLGLVLSVFFSMVDEEA